MASIIDDLPHWDIMYLPSGIRGLYFYLYLILDMYSREIVGWEVQATESGEQAATLLRRTALGEAIQTWRAPLVLHADNGEPMKSATLLATLQWLGVTSSHSRTAYRTTTPLRRACSGPASIARNIQARALPHWTRPRAWVMRFESWYNTEHRHSGLNFVTPEQRDAGRGHHETAH